MSNTLQPIDSIAQSGSDTSKEPVDPIKEEYEEGKKFFESEEYGQAAAALHNALVGYEEKDDEVGIANASNYLGKVCLARADNETALSHFQRVLDICEKSNDRMSIIAVSKQFVTAYRGLELYDKAIATCLDLLDHYQDNRDPQGSVTTLEEMVQIYLCHDQKKNAADAYRTISSIHENFGHKNMANDFLKKAEKLEETTS